MSLVRAHLMPVSILIVSVVSNGCGWTLGLDEYSPSENKGPSCTNGSRDGDETDIDCGGSCASCAALRGCITGKDCESLVCIGNLCRAPECTDGVRNGDETDQDCGSGCPGCADGRVCGKDIDCQSSVCSSGRCQAPSCSDGVENALETDIDCGGVVCSRCAPEAHCDKPTDCESGICEVECVDHHVWSASFGDTKEQQGYSSHVAVDSLGNVLFHGALRGTFGLGGAAFTEDCEPDQRTHCVYDAFIAKFDASGKHVWSKQFKNENDDGNIFFALTGGDSLILAGYWDFSIDLGGGPLPDPAPCDQGCDVDTFVAKLDKNGVHQWSKSFGGDGSQAIYSVAGDNQGGAALTGTFDGSFNFGGNTLTSSGYGDLFVGRLNSAGNHIWSKSFGESKGDQTGTNIAVDNILNVFVAGYFSKSINFGNGPLFSAGDTDLFLAKLDSLGNCVWSRRFGDITSQITGFVAVDKAGNAIYAAEAAGNIDFDGGVLTNAGGKDIFVAKFDPFGKHIWSKRFGDSTDESVRSVAVDPAGNIVLTGSFSGVVDFGGGPLVSAGSSDVFIAKLSPAGDHLWSKRFGDESPQNGAAVAAAGSQHVIMAGGFEGVLNLGGAPLVSAGISDLFLAKLRTP